MDSTLTRRRFVLTASAATAAMVAAPAIITESASAATFPKGPVPTTLDGLETYLADTVPPIYLLNSAVPKNFSTTQGSSMEMSPEHAMVGTQSLKWDHAPSGALTIDAPIAFRSDRYKHGATGVASVVDYFAFWVYREAPSTEQLTVSFGEGDRRDCWFTMNLNFTGWRTAWVRYGYDTEGRPTDSMNRVTFTAPPSAGTMWIDQVIVDTDLRGDYATPDDQIPFTQKDIHKSANYHWQGLYNYQQRLTKPGFDTSNVTAKEERAADTIRERLVRAVSPSDPKNPPKNADEVDEKIKELGIPPLKDPNANGADLLPAHPGSMVNDHQTDIWPSKVRNQLIKAAHVVKARQVMDLTLVTARAWREAEESGNAAAAARSGEQFIRIMAYMFNQGWASGSTQGTIHHIGYAFRSWAKAVIVAQPLLQKRGLWEQASQAITWYAGTGRLNHDFSDASHVSGMIDVLNTLLNALLISCVFPEKKKDQVGRLRAFESWINHAFSYTPGTTGGFKPDGSLTHHRGEYAAYGRDALSGSVPVLLVVRGTPFNLNPDHILLVKNALLYQSRISNTYEYPIAWAGRHPTGIDGMHQGLKGIINLYGELGLHPLDGSEGPDPVMAGEFLRLMPPEPDDELVKLDRELKAIGAKRTPAPQGYWEYGYSASTQHRHDDWSVTVRGHNQYIWTAEIYKGSNLGGRYLRYGQIEIQARKDAQGIVTHAANGWVQPGFDWRRIPGATTLIVPMQEFMADMTGRSSIMPMSESAFGGGGALPDGASLFGMDLRENPMFNRTHHARVSAMLVGDRIIALGSNISNDDTKNPTQTTLFQVTPETIVKPEKLAVGDNWVSDPAGNSFVVLDGNLKHSSGPQTFADQSGKGEGTRNYTIGWLDHGTAPSDAHYAYVGLVQGGAARAKEVAAAPENTVQIIQKDKVAHVVRDVATAITGTTIFEADQNLVEGSPVKSASRPCLVLTQPVDDGVRISVTDPDLHFSKEKDPDVYDKNGNYIGGKGPYTQPWQTHESPITTISVMLPGKWKISGDVPKASAKVSGENTELTLKTQHAASRVLKLVPAGAVPKQPEPTKPGTPSPSPSEPGTPSPSTPASPSPAPSGGGTPAPGSPSPSPSSGGGGTGGGGGNTGGGGSTGGGYLPRTGVDMAAPAALAAGLVGAGALLAHRSRTASAAAGATGNSAIPARTEIAEPESSDVEKDQQD